MHPAARLQRLLHQARVTVAAPSRNARTAVVIGRLLAIGFLICMVTGVFSHFHQDPLPWMVFPTRPVWLYQFTQGLHVVTGVACIPLLLAKLYAVFPQLLQHPPVRSAAHLVERASIAVFVAASLVQLAIGLLNTYQLFPVFGFSFRLVHYALAWVVVGSLLIHLGVKLPVIAAHWTKRRSQADDDDDDHVEPPLDAPDELQRLTGVRPTAGLTGRLFAWIDRAPAPAGDDPRVATSRRAFFATVGASTAVLVTFTVGQTLGALNPVNLFAPRKRTFGPQALPVNRTASAAGVLDLAVAPDWTLTVAHGETREVFPLSRLRALPQHDVVLPIACVEGWSQEAAWRGPRVRDLLDAVGAPPEATVRITSLQQRGGFGVTEMTPEFVRDPLTLVALELNGDVLDLDHGYPARIIAPARPGVLQTKWLSSIEVIA